MRRILNNERGQFIAFVAVALIILGLLIGLAIDAGRAYLLRAQLSGIVDASALAAAKVLKGQPEFEDDAVKAACDAMLMNSMNVEFNIDEDTCASGGDANFTLSVEFVDKAVGGGTPLKFVQVRGTVPLNLTFMRLAKFITGNELSEIPVTAFAEAGPERPVDLMLVLDRSGSMTEGTGTGQTKIVALKAAMADFLDNTFSGDDRVGMTSFAYRGCGEGGDDFTGVDCTENADVKLTDDIDSIKDAVEGLKADGYTNIHETLLVAEAEIENAVLNSARERSRKAVLLVTDGQPTALRRFNDSTCKQDPDGSTLPPPGDGNAGGGPFPDGCIHRLNIIGGTGLRRHPLDLSTQLTVTGGTEGASLYRDLAADQRTKAREKADDIKSLGSNNVIIFAIAVGTDSASVPPKNRLDANAKCFLARVTNDPASIFNCDNVYTTSDNSDTYNDLKAGIPAGSCAANPSSCLDPDHLQGKVYVIDQNANVEQLLKDAFNDIAALLKLRLTI